MFATLSAISFGLDSLRLFSMVRPTFIIGINILFDWWTWNKQLLIGICFFLAAITIFISWQLEYVTCNMVIHGLMMKRLMSKLTYPPVFTSIDVGSPTICRWLFLNGWHISIRGLSMAFPHLSPGKHLVETHRFTKNPHPKASAKPVGVPVFQGFTVAHHPGNLWEPAAWPYHDCISRIFL